MVHCNRCHKQYIGETKRRLKDRFNEHRRTVDKQTNRSKPTTVSEHFLSNDHNASDMLLIPLELIKSNRDSVRKAREAYLIDRGQTLEPLGLNRRDETWTFSRLSSSLFMLLSPITYCNVIYVAHAYILNFQISNCNVFVYVTLAFLRYPIVTVFIVTIFATRSVSNTPWRRKAVPFEILERKNIFPKPWNQPCSYIICYTIVWPFST